MTPLTYVPSINSGIRAASLGDNTTGAGNKILNIPRAAQAR